jgi:PPM family protein phosphatase
MLDCSLITRQSGEHTANDDFAAIDNELGILVVADGMGGRPGGAQASRVATEAFLEMIRSVPEQSRIEVSNLRNAVSSANRSVRSLADADPSLEGLGTTLSAVVLNDAKGKIVHVGDSRLYLFGDQGLRQLTKDHTLVAELVERRHLSPEGAKRYPLKNMLSRSIGPQETVDADIDDLELAPREWLLLTTDGLTKALGQERLVHILEISTAANAEQLCRDLLDAAVLEEPNDDITIIAARLSEAALEKT